eukprot:CAMPEP_0203962574 /NCGR_PEP_ID=MMETSP0359-20131031/92724_1 /ASSEMBLY_ACC=CAM_ASM_000338 /TAXON_ID=268821 /ORGANISM="Scrippsiella Hangoei, Strain SHTV-5" /LENGTH=108 /DNA_ID=CAMNT_0050897939 /DNA_START=63 /DNA_END=389 /DNA_ORIENTATION=+
MARRSGSALLGAALVVLAMLAASTAFLPQPSSPQHATSAAAAAAAGLAATSALPLLPASAADVHQQLLQGSTIAMAWQPWENPGIVWIFLMASFTMSIALVVWGRNGF